MDQELNGGTLHLFTRAIAENIGCGAASISEHSQISLQGKLAPTIRQTSYRILFSNNSNTE